MTMRTSTRQNGIVTARCHRRPVVACLVGRALAGRALAGMALAGLVLAIGLAVPAAAQRQQPLYNPPSQPPLTASPEDESLPVVTSLRVTDHGGFARLTVDLTAPVDFTYGPTTRPTVMVIETRGAVWSFPAGRRKVRSRLMSEYAYVPLSPGHGRLFLATHARARVAHIATLDPSRTRGPWRLVIDITRATGQRGADRPYGFVNWGTRVRTALARTRGFDLGQGGQFVLHRAESFGTGQTRATRVLMPGLNPGGVAADRPEPGRIVPVPGAGLPPPAGAVTRPRAYAEGAPVRPPAPRLVTFDTNGAPQPRDGAGRQIAYRVRPRGTLDQGGTLVPVALAPARAPAAVAPPARDRQLAAVPIWRQPPDGRLPGGGAAARTASDSAPGGLQQAQIPIDPTVPDDQARRGLAVAGDEAGPAAADDLFGDDYPENGGISDPIEGVNRVVFDVNDFLDTWILRPIAWTYGEVAPTAVKSGLRNAFSNLREPVNLANHLFQLEFEKAAETTGRFLINSTVGLAGLWDPATDWGLPEQRTDFGHTLYSYDVGSGPYVVLPLLGPSSVRDGAGRVVDSFLDPLVYLTGTPVRLGLAGGRTVVERERVLEPLDALKADSIDYYATLRSLWHQNRTSDLQRWSGEAAAVPEF